MTTVAFLGAGKLAEAIVRGLLAAEPSALRLVCTARRPERAAALRALGVDVEDNATATREADVVVLGVRHGDLPALAAEVAPVARGKTVVSLAAGAPLAAVELLFQGAHVARALTNVAAEARAATTALAFPEAMPENDRTAVRALFRAVGEVVELRDADLDAANALTGAGPAFVALFAAALGDGGVAAGLPLPLAARLAAGAVRAAAALLERAPASALLESVAGPGGATKVGLDALTEAGVARAAASAVVAATARSRERSHLAASWSPRP